MAEPNVPILMRRSLIGATAETTCGTIAAVTTPMTGVQVFDAKLEADDWYTQGEREPLGTYVGSVAAVSGNRTGILTYRQMVRAGDAFTTTGAAASLLNACAFYGAAATYLPTSDMTPVTKRPTYTLAIFQGDIAVTSSLKGFLYGAVADLELEYTNGSPLWANWTWKGIWSPPVDVALPTQAPIAGSPLVVGMGGYTTCTINSAAPPMWSRVRISLGNEIAFRPSPTTASGILYAYVQSWKHRITIDTEARLVAQLDNYGLMLAGTEHALSLGVTDGTHGITISAPKMQRRKISPGVRDGILTHELEFACNMSTGDDDMQVVMS